jgi:competence protein ComEC
VAVASAFASGIAIGLHPRWLAHTGSRQLVAGFFLAAMVVLVAAAILLARNRLYAAAVASLVCWAMLGMTGAFVAEQPRPRDHVISLAEAGQLDLHTPLRWHGSLRDEPARLPWGYGYEVSLSGVDYRGAYMPLRGGMRVSYSQPADAGGNAPAPPEVHAGDEITVVTDARQPQLFRDAGAFDRRAYLAGQNIDLVATLRAAELMTRVSPGKLTAGVLIARARRRLRDELDALLDGRPDVAGVLRAMLLGDRSFVERAESANFQRTGVFHVLVVAGLHVGAIAYALFWLGRRLRLPVGLTTLLTLILLAAYVAVVEQRPPVLRAALMAGIVALGTLFFRRLDLLNSAAIAALLLLAARPLALADPSFQLTFVAIGCIAGIATPWMERRVQPYVRALRGWREAARDTLHEPQVAQFRIDLRSALQWITTPWPQKAVQPLENSLVWGLSVGFRIFELLVITLVLQIGMEPLMTSAFHRVTLAAPVANLVAVPLMGVLVPLGFAAILGGLLFAPLGRVLGAALSWLTSVLLSLVKYFGAAGHGNYRVPGPPMWLTVLFFVAAIALAVALRSRSRGARRLGMASASLLAAGAVIMAIFPFAPHRHRGELELTVLDVGQGDALFLVSPGGTTLLIDGGGAFAGFPGKPEHNGIDPGEEAVSPYLWSRGFKHIDFVAATHGHLDHVGGLTAVLENFQVGTLWIGREISGSAQERLENLARARGVRVVHELRGEKLDWDGAAGEVLWPESAGGDPTAPAKNNDSLVMRWGYGGRSFLLPGDAEKQVERELLSETAPEGLRADVLKVGHHGSKNSTTEEFLAAVRPQVAVISAGENNPYGHPSPQLLERLERAHVRVLRTDRDGAVQILTDGSTLDISCFVACPPVTEESATRNEDGGESPEP